MQGEDPLGSDRQPIDMKPSTDHLMQSMAIGYPGPRTKMDGKDQHDAEALLWLLVQSKQCNQHENENNVGYPGTKIDGNDQENDDNIDNILSFFQFFFLSSTEESFVIESDAALQLIFLFY